MKKIEVVEKAMTIRFGSVELTKDQAKSRKHNLTHLVDNLYEVKNPIQFKVGESFSFEASAEKKEPKKKAIK